MKKSITILRVVVILGISLCMGCSNQTKGKETKIKDEVQATKVSESPTNLIVYSGAGLKNAMEEIKTEYETSHNVRIEYVYAGSTQLLSQMELSGKGDVFIVGSEKAYEISKEKNLSNKPLMVAHHTPCIAVAKGNPKGISGLEDLAKKDIKVILGDPKANAIGLTAKKNIEKAGLEAINNNVVSLTSTVSEIVLQLKNGQADAGIVTIDAIDDNSDLEIVNISKEQNIDQIIPVCTLKSSKNPKQAEEFAKYIESKEGKEIFEKNGFEPVNSDEK